MYVAVVHDFATLPCSAHHASNSRIAVRRCGEPSSSASLMA
ncbi:hypothetical protein [Streptomyces pactum]|nr:hypothetical protein [Streptomyces pactum]